MKYVYTLFFCIIITSLSAMAQNTKQNHGDSSGKAGASEFGCSCDWLKACQKADCGPQCGFCADSSGRGCAVCLCKAGGMKHCTNWDDIINDSDCSSQKNDYCTAIYGPNNYPAACQNDPICNQSQTTKKK